MHGWTKSGLFMIGTLLLAGPLSAQASRDGAAPVTVIPAWLYPGNDDAPPPRQADSVRLIRVPWSGRRFTEAAVKNLFSVPDWRPAGHPVMPPVVSVGRQPDVYACGYCHLPNGGGRPENAPLAGLPADYIVRQVADLKSGARRGPPAGTSRPWDLMHAVAVAATEEEIRVAADYFAAIRLGPRVRVVESATIPRPRQIGWRYAVGPGPRERLGARIVEAPLDETRHELRDAALESVAYVPPGSIERGAVLATEGVSGLSTACTTCHGPDLKGLGVAPPIAGRSPTYLLRQLVNFSSGRRDTPAGQPMALTASQLSLDEMIAVAAYVGSRRP